MINYKLFYCTSSAIEGFRNYSRRIVEHASFASIKYVISIKIIRTFIRKIAAMISTNGNSLNQGYLFHIINSPYLV